MDEIWKDICFYDNVRNITFDFTGLYMVSNFGRIKSLKNNDEVLLKSTEDCNGYHVVALYKEKNRYLFRVHRIVAHIFLPIEKDKPFVDHIIPVSKGGTDEASNLRWCTQKENINNELTKITMSESMKGLKHYNAMIKIICVTTNEIFESAREAEKKYNISNQNISKCCKRKLFSAGKHPLTGEKLVWRYLDEYDDSNKEILLEQAVNCNKGKNNPTARKILCVTTGEVFNSLKEASEKYKVNSSNICNCCKNKRKYTKSPINGLKLEWKYI